MFSRSKKKDDGQAFLTGRIRAASTGTIWDFELEEYVDVATAPARVFLEHTRRRAEKLKRDHKETIQSKALDQAKSEPNDPFAYARTKMHLQGGLCELDDYDVEFKRVTTDVNDLFSGEVVGRTMRDVPMRRRRA